jgi:hypothetical protein
MSREAFPAKRAGDGLSASHINDINRVVGNLSGGNQGSGLQGTHGWITGVAGQLGPFLRIAKVRKETDVPGVYTIRLRRWNTTDAKWKDETNDCKLDARCFTFDPSDEVQRAPVLVYDDVLSVRYDGQRGMYLPDQFLFPNSRWAWVSTAIPARSGSTEYSETVKLVKQTLNVAGDENEWTYLTDYESNEVTARCFNGFPDEIEAEIHIRIGWNSLGQYEVKGVPCSEDASL